MGLRIRLMVLVAIALLATPPGLGATDPLTPEERAFINAHGPIRHAPDPSYPPFEFFDGANFTGINADLLNRMSRNLGVEFETVRVGNWSAALLAMRERRIDLLGALAHTAERDSYMDFTDSYARLGEVFYVTSPDLRSVSDLVGKRVAVVQGYAAGTWLRSNHPDLTITEVPDTLTGLNRLSAGEVDALFENIPVTGYYIRTTGLSGVRIMGDPLYYSPVQWAVPQDERLMLSIIQKGMASLSTEERTNVFEFWTGSDIGPEPAEPGLSPTARNLLIGLAIAVLAIFAWSLLLRRTVAKRTAEIAQLNEELEARVARRTAELERANRDLQAFSSTLSHDLRTPLTLLRTNHELLARHLAPGTDGPRLLDRVRRGTQRMDSLVEDILRFSRASGGRIERSQVDLSTLAHEVGRSLHEAHPDRQVVLEVQPGLVANADPSMMRVALENLLANAWKFTRSRHPAHVVFGRQGENGPFFVRDDGVGFDTAAAGKLFQPFERLHDQESFEGTGIGLSTVARIIERHGGKVWGEAQPDKGATFRFTIGPEPPAAG